jgi:Zn-dependent peptidase ImmA (M78 family)/DNA-binding XRE family transcriptional regulator
MSSFGEVLETARRAKGWTQAELAEALGVKQAAISRYEHDMREPSAEALADIAKALGVTEGFLIRATAVEGAMAIDAHMRRRATAQPTVWRRIEARLNMYRAHAAELMNHVTVEASRAIPSFDPIWDEPEAVARMVRMQWRLPVGPVRRLYPWIEAAGCLIIEEDFGTRRVDGLSQWVGDHPVMLLNSEVPTDRKRLTAAHELGHLVLHRREVSDDVEADANRFAAEFLMPSDVIRPQLRNLTIGRLHDLKREWGVSMQALIERASQLEVLSTSERTRLYKLFSARGWRMNEPLSNEIPREEPQLLRTIGTNLSAAGLSGSEIAQLAGYRDEAAADLLTVALDQRRLRIV